MCNRIGHRCARQFLHEGHVRWRTKIPLEMENNICLADLATGRIFKYLRRTGETIATPLDVRLFSFELAADVSSSFPAVSSREGRH